MQFSVNLFEQNLLAGQNCGKQKKTLSFCFQNMYINVTEAENQFE